MSILGKLVRLIHKNDISPEVLFQKSHRWLADGSMLVCVCSILNYLVDSYTIFAASVLAANNARRSIFAAGFPLFTPTMYDNLGIHWASSVPAFLALACVPMPFLLYKYGEAVRKKCKYAAESAAVMEKTKGRADERTVDVETSSEKNSDIETAK